MKILHTAWAYPPLVSGIPEVVRQISERLAARGHEVHVATGMVEGLPRDEVRRGVTVHRFEIKGNLLGGISGETQAYLDLVRSREWDVIVPHCSQIWSTDLLFSINLQSPIIFVAHGLTYQDPTFRKYYEQLADWLRQGRTMVSLSSVGIDDGEFRRDHGLRDAVIIPNGVDQQEWNGPKLGVRPGWGREGTPWLVNISTHNPAKQHGDLFALVDELRKRGQRVHLTQIGCGNLAHKWNLGKLGIFGGCYYKCRSRALFADGISLVFNKPRAETVSAIREADLMVLPSSWEASPLVVLECMAAGTPFVSYDVGCVREHVGGRVVKTLHEMADAVVELLANDELRRDLGEQGKRRIAERHDWEVIAGMYERLYDQVATEARRQKPAHV